jgi:hypothetical protein
MASASNVVLEGFTVDYPIELTISQETPGNGRTISSPTSNILFTMDSHGLSTCDRCTLLDTEGNPIMTARKDVIGA